MSATTLIVKHLPSELSDPEKEELFALFGAKKVRCMPNRGKLKCVAFVTFTNHLEAKQALLKLHQLEILNQRLVVEFAKKEHLSLFPKEGDFPDFKEKQIEETKVSKVSEKEQLHQDSLEFSRKLHGVCATLGLDYLPSPILKYNYPSPNAGIIANISHALISVPRFYTQVLHLMNKMNLPAPFGPVTPVPPCLTDQNVLDNIYMTDALNVDKLEEQDMDTGTEEESEMESEEENVEKKVEFPQKRTIRRIKKYQKKPKLNQFKPIAVQPGKITEPRTEPADVFESLMLPENQKKIQFNINPNFNTDNTANSDNFPVPQSESGFGFIDAAKIGDNANEREGENEDESSDVSGFISLRELRRKKVSRKEMKTLPVFRSYSPGDPTVRLYIKNLARQVEEKDLKFIFGRFIDWDSEIDKNMFDVRLMKEGRMKGQAFVTLANEHQAIEAVAETNGFLLHTKPLVVQFARSAKPKDNPEKK